MKKKVQRWVDNSCNDHLTVQNLHQLLEMDRGVDKSSTHCISVASTAPSSGSSLSFSCFEAKSCLKVKKQEDSICKIYQLSPKETNRQSPCIEFQKVTVHYHKLTLGDHPGVSCGAPLALGCWESSEELSVTDHECERKARCQKSPWEERTTIPAPVRERMLMEDGVSFRSIRRRVTQIKLQNELQLKLKLLVSRRPEEPTELLARPSKELIEL